MTDQAPGVRFNESSERVQVTGVDASLAAFIGLARRGRTDKPELVQGWAGYTERYGGLHDTRTDLGDYLWDFFDNGGTQAYIQRIVGSNAVGASNAAVLNRLGAGNTAFGAYAANEGEWGNSLSLNLKRFEVRGVGAPVATDPNAIDLPGSLLNVNSQDIGRLAVTSLTGINIGDFFDVFNPTTGAHVTNGPIQIVGFDTATPSVYFVARDTRAAFIAACPAAPILRTNSQHRARTLATTQLIANTEDDVALQSVEGIKPGSLLSFTLFSHVSSLTTRSVGYRTQAIVDRVVGKRVIFVAASNNTAAVPAATKAYRRWIMAGADGINWEAMNEGAGGNSTTVSVTEGVANQVTVIGRHVAIEWETGAGAWTTQEAVDAINAHATASQLVLASRQGADVPLSADLVEAALEGGAWLQVTSQEFWLEIKENGVVVEKGKHEYLSMIPTSADYIGTRLGGTLVPLVPADTSPSKRLILNGQDGDTDPAVDEINQHPLAVESIALAGGEDGDALTDDQMLGTSNPKTGLYLLDGIEDIDLAAAPGYTSPTFVKGATAWTDARQNIVFLFDIPSDLSNAEEMLSYRQQDLGVDSSYVQMFGPYGRRTDPRRSAPKGTIIDIPATPMVAAALAKTIKRNGAHTSCGGYQPTSWTDIKVRVTEEEHGVLNSAGISIIKVVKNSGIRIWGDRTMMQTEDLRTSGNVRRWLNYAKASIANSLQSQQFKPIQPSRFAAISHGITRFLEKEWKAGALYPDDSISDAFYVKVDAETTTADDIVAKRIKGAVGVSPAPSTEFIEFDLNVSPGGVRVSET